MHKQTKKGNETESASICMTSQSYLYVCVFVCVEQTNALRISTSASGMKEHVKRVHECNACVPDSYRSVCFYAGIFSHVVPLTNK